MSCPMIGAHFYSDDSSLSLRMVRSSRKPVAPVFEGLPDFRIKTTTGNWRVLPVWLPGCLMLILARRPCELLHIQVIISHRVERYACGGNKMEKNLMSYGEKDTIIWVLKIVSFFYSLLGKVLFYAFSMRHIAIKLWLFVVLKYSLWKSCSEC